MILTLLKGYPDLIGRRQAMVGYGSGPASYSQTTGDVISIPGYERYIDSVLSISQDPTGTYIGQARPSAVGARATWSIHWYVVATGVEVANGVNLSAYNLQIPLFTGEC